MNKNSNTPGYLELHRKGLLRERAEFLWKILTDCELCPRECGVNRLDGETGFCRATSRLKVASCHAHFGEERALVGTGGSGTIFLSHCNLGCVFCQNWDISHQGSGSHVEVEELVLRMLGLQQEGCHNINIVTPTHYSPHVLLALDISAGKGLRLPLVWNTCGLERREILEILEGVVDIYLADFKYMSSQTAGKYAEGARSYPSITREALKEMDRQVGLAQPGKQGMISRGLMIRHLVMPGHTSESEEAVRWISENLPRETYLNIMIQYRPACRAHLFPEIDAYVSRSEYRQVVEEARRCGLTNLDVDI